MFQLVKLELKMNSEKHLRESDSTKSDFVICFLTFLEVQVNVHAIFKTELIFKKYLTETFLKDFLPVNFPVAQNSLMFKFPEFELSVLSLIVRKSPNFNQIDFEEVGSRISQRSVFVSFVEIGGLGLFKHLRIDPESEVRVGVSPKTDSTRISRKLSLFGIEVEVVVSSLSVVSIKDAEIGIEAKQKTVPVSNISELIDWF